MGTIKEFGRFILGLLCICIVFSPLVGLAFLESRWQEKVAEEFQAENPELFAERLEAFKTLRPGDLVLHDPLGEGWWRVYTVLEKNESGSVTACELGSPGMIFQVYEFNAHTCKYVSQDDPEAYQRAIVDDLSFNYKANFSEVGKILRERME